MTKKLALGVSIFFANLLGLSGCQSFQNLAGHAQEKKYFEVRKTWAIQTTDTDQSRYRKINRMSPLIYSGLKGDYVIQAQSTDGIQAFAQSSGRLIWKQSISEGVEASASLFGKKLFVASLNGDIYSLSAETGDILWKFHTPFENLSAPLVTEQNVFFLNGANTLYALDAQGGQQSWVYSRPDPTGISIRGGSKPLLKDGVLYVGFSDGYLVAVQASTGAMKWEKRLNANKKWRDLDSDPVIDGEYIYMMGYDDHFYAVNSVNGEIIWKYDQGGFGLPLVTQDKIYFPTSQSEMVCLDKETGRKVWSYNGKNGLMTSPTQGKGLLIFGEAQGSLVFLDALTGRKVGDFYPGRGVLTQPLESAKNSLVYFTSGEGHLYSVYYNWTYSPPFPFLVRQ